MLHGALRTDTIHDNIFTWIEIYHLRGKLEVAGLQNDALRAINKLTVRGFSSPVSFWKAWRKAERGSTMRNFLSVRLREDHFKM